MNSIQILKNAGLKATNARIALLDEMKKSHNPRDAKEYLIALKKSGHLIDLVTIYRILETLVAKNIVKQLNFNEGKFRYELEEDHHHHLVCQNCGDISAIYGEWLKKAEKEIGKKYHFEVTNHSLEFFGTCKHCGGKS